MRPFLLALLTITHTAFAVDPIAIGSRLEPLIDNALIESFSGKAELVLHHPVARETAIVHDAPWEGSGTGYHSVFKDGDRYRMYYKAWHLDVKPGAKGKATLNTGSHPLYTCYAERADGVHWLKPTTALPIVLGRGDAAGKASIAFSKGGIESAAQWANLAQTFRINKTNTTTFATTTTGNPCNVKMSPTSSTGLFSGSFVLSDSVSGKVVPRTVNYAGILLSHRNLGLGYFLLPGLTPSTATSPVLGGRVTVN